MPRPTRKPMTPAQLDAIRSRIPEPVYSFRPYKPVALRSDVQARMDAYRAIPSQPDRKP